RSIRHARRPDYRARLQARLRDAARPRGRGGRGAGGDLQSMDEAGERPARLERTAVVPRHRGQPVPEHATNAVVVGHQAGGPVAHDRFPGGPGRARCGSSPRAPPAADRPLGSAGPPLLPGPDARGGGLGGRSADRHDQVPDLPRPGTAPARSGRDERGVRMNQELLIRRLKAALDVAPADPALRARVISSLPLDRRQAHPSRLGWAGAVAAVLVVATVAALVLLGPSRPSPRSQTTIPLADCKLPIYGQAAYQSGQQTIYAEGFLDLSDGSFSRASAASTTQVDHLRALPGSGGISYDRTFDAWLPVPSSWIAPDGLSYAYLSGPNGSQT